MAVAFIMDFQGGEAEQYDEVLERMGLDGRLAEHSMFHAAGPGPNGGWRVVDVWESDEHFEKFAQEQIGPHTAAVGLSEPAITRVEAREIVDHRDEHGVGSFLQVVHIPRMDEEKFRAMDGDVRPDGDPDGMAFHVNGPGPDGAWVVVDTWVAKDVRDAFMAEKVGPAAAKHHAEQPALEEMEIHNTLS